MSAKNSGSNELVEVKILSPWHNKEIVFQAEPDFSEFLKEDVVSLLKMSPMDSVLGETLSSENFIDGLILEFGVFSGKTINQIAHRFHDRKTFGFDSFEGLPSDWIVTGSKFEIKKSVFDTHATLPVVLDNVELVKGYFSDTLPDFLQDNEDPISFMHVDCDLYESTKTIFNLCEPRIIPGTIIVFDEFFDYLHEARAFFEYLDRTKRKFRWIGHGGDGGILFDKNAVGLLYRNLTPVLKMALRIQLFFQGRKMNALPNAAAIVII